MVSHYGIGGHGGALGHCILSLLWFIAIVYGLLVMGCYGGFMMVDLRWVWDGLVGLASSAGGMVTDTVPPPVHQFRRPG